MAGDNWFTRNIKKRKLIRKDENKVSYVQIIGFGLIAIGILYMTLYRMITHISSSEGMAISFFIIMLGMSFAFPSMLEGPDKELSTMRIVVFMMVNVICLLLLKIGWSADVHSLSQIGLDEYWVGIIAFVFGAKATQSYFESKLAVAKKGQPAEPEALTYTDADIAKMAIAQNEASLKKRFSNIISVSDAVNDLNSQQSHIITIYLSDDTIAGIPNSLPVKLADGTIKTIDTEIVECVGEGHIQVNQRDKIQTKGSDSTGSVCCLVELENGSKAVITAGHVYSEGRSDNSGGELLPSGKKKISIDGHVAGEWFFQRINNRQDIAIATLTNFQTDPAYVSFDGKELYPIRDQDIKTEKTNITLVSAEKGERNGFILDHNISWVVPYFDKVKIKNNIILVGTTNDRKTSKTLSKPGDSGGCVYHSGTKRLIGLILGGDNRFTWVLPIDEPLQNMTVKFL